MSPEIISAVVLFFHWLIMLGLSARVIMRRPPIGVALAWLAIICSVPFLGAFIYLFFGEKRLGGGRARRIAASVTNVQAWQAYLWQRFSHMTPSMSEAAHALAYQAEKTRGFKPLSRNQLEILAEGDTFFTCLAADIDSANETVHLGFYIWQEGGAAEHVIAALIRAAQRGVECRALADAFGSKAFFKSGSLTRLKEAGVEVIAAMPRGSLRTFFARVDLRNHRKIAVIDRRVAYTGSQNLVDPAIFKQDAGVGEWVDAMLRISGPAATCLDGVFELDWSIEKNTTFQAPTRLIEHDHEDQKRRPFDDQTPADSTVQVLPSGPDLQPETIHQILLSAIYSARHELILTTPYFVPDDAILTALISAANSGVAVTLIVPERNDSLMVRYASVAHFDDLMTAGVRIALFNKGLLHTKSLSVDGAVSIFGSVNIDMRSLWLNFEISLIIYDKGFTERLQRLQKSYLQSADWLDPDVWQKRPAYKRFLSNTCRLLSPLL